VKRMKDTFRFILTKENISIRDIKFLQGVEIKEFRQPDGEIIYEVQADPNLIQKMKVIEEAGFIRPIKEEVREVESIEDLIRLTKKVEIVQGGSLYMRVHLGDHILTFNENQLLTPTMFRKYLLRLGKILRIKQKDWEELAQYWLDIAEKVDEVSEEGEIEEKFLNYIRECRIVKEVEQAILPYTILLKDDEFFVSTDTVAEKLGVGKRKLRSILSDYIIGSSVQFRSHGRRYRFWKLSEKSVCEIDVKKQLEEEEVEKAEEAKEEAEEEATEEGEEKRDECEGDGERAEEVWEEAD